VTAIDTPMRPQPAPDTRRPASATGRLLRLELRRSTMLLVLPLLAVLLGFTELRNDLSQAPLWAVRSLVVQRAMELTGGIVAGVAAWVAARDGRGHTTDLVATTARPRWVRQLVRWAAVTAWAMLFFAAYVAALFVVTARQATWGSPIWWPIGVAAAAIVACSAVGFAFGSLFPGRFTAPVVTVVALLAPQIGVLALQRGQQWGRVSPVEDASVPGTGIFLPFHPGLSIVQIMFLTGVSIAALSVIALPSGRALFAGATYEVNDVFASGARRLRRTATIIMLAGLVLAGSGLALANTARQGSEGIVIPALHHAANDTPVTYTPVCDTTATVPICIHPAYKALLLAMATALDPILDQVTGLPGAPIRVQLAPATPQNINVNEAPGPSYTTTQEPTISGNPPVLYLSPNLLTLDGGTTFTNDLLPRIQDVRQDVAATIIVAVIGGGQPVFEPDGNPAQQAIATALLIDGGTGAASSRERGGTPPAGSPAFAAAHRFAALPAATRHTWLAANLIALQAGQITLSEIP
jgi:hypothetical protein